MNLKEYVDFYKKLKILDSIFKNMKNLLNKETTEENFESLFEAINLNLIEETKQAYIKLFEISNFCYSNRWGSYDCILCRMTFLQESQYNEHEKQETHKNNLTQCASSEFKIFNFNLKEFNLYKILENLSNFEPVVFLSILEHNSNALPWRETGCKIIYIEQSSNNTFDMNNLENILKENVNKIIKIGSFTAASNITGAYIDVDEISLILHKYNSLAFFDYATAAPYIKADMNKPLNKELRKLMGFKREFTNEEESLIYKDSIFFSPHKFLGGPNSPGVLIIKQHVVRNLLTPSEPGGGVVLFVRKEHQK